MNISIQIQLLKILYSCMGVYVNPNDCKGNEINIYEY